MVGLDGGSITIENKGKDEAGIFWNDFSHRKKKKREKVRGGLT